MAIKTKIQERNFAEAWLSNGQNATEAYLTIKPDVSRESAKELGSRLLTNINVQEIIKQRQEEVSKESKITRESLLKDYDDIKKRNIGDNDKVAILAMQEQAKLLGLNAPDKIESLNKNINIDGELTNDELNELEEAINESSEA